MPLPDLYRCRFRCTRLTREGEFGIPHRLAFMEGKIAILNFDMANTFQYEGVVEILGVIQPNEVIPQSEIEWSL